MIDAQFFDTELLARAFAYSVKCAVILQESGKWLVLWIPQ